MENDETITVMATVLLPGQFFDSGGSTTFATVLLEDNDCEYICHKCRFKHNHLSQLCYEFEQLK